MDDGGSLGIHGVLSVCVGRLPFRALFAMGWLDWMDRFSFLLAKGRRGGFVILIEWMKSFYVHGKSRASRFIGLDVDGHVHCHGKSFHWAIC